MARCLGRAPESDEDAHHQARAALCPSLKDIVWQKEAGASLPASKPESKLPLNQPAVLGQKFVFL